MSYGVYTGSYCPGIQSGQLHSAGEGNQHISGNRIGCEIFVGREFAITPDGCKRDACRHGDIVAGITANGKRGNGKDGTGKIY